MSWRWRSHTSLLCKLWQRTFCVNIPYLAPISSFSPTIFHVSSGFYFMVCNTTCCFKPFQLFLNCFPVWSWIIRKHAPEFRTLVVATVFTACHTQICVTTGDESKEHLKASPMCSVGTGRSVGLCVEDTRLGGKRLERWVNHTHSPTVWVLSTLPPLLSFRDKQRAATDVLFPPKRATGRAETLEERRRKTAKAEIKQDRTKGHEHWKARKKVTQPRT